MTSRFILPNADVGNGIAPSDGAQLFFFETGTSTPKDTFTDSSATTPNANPVVSDADGVFPDIWITGTYKVQLKDKNGVQTGFGEADPVSETVGVGDKNNDLRYAPKFATVAAMVAANPVAIDGTVVDLQVGMIVAIDDYSTGNNSGILFGRVVAGATGTADGGSYIDLANGNQFRQNFSRHGISVKQYGVAGDGVTDDTAALITVLGLGGDIIVPTGDYLIPNAGADAGGVYVELVKSLTVTCAPNARFFTDAAAGVDNDLIRLFCPDSGVPADGITVTWKGGVIDQRNQKNSTSLPFSTNYPPQNLGTSGTTDGLSIIGEYDDGVHQNGIIKATVIDSRFIATDNKWESAGGDSGLNIGTASATVTGCYFKGNRDLGIYFSSDSPGDGLGAHFHCTGNTFEDCMFGVSGKRGSDLVTIYGNTFRRCIQAIACEAVIDKRSTGWSVANNTIDGYIFAIDLSTLDGVSVIGNVMTNAGVLLESGSAPTLNFGSPDTIQLGGVTNSTIMGNIIYGKIPAFAANTVNAITLAAFDPGSGSVNSNHNLITNNNIRDITNPFIVASDLQNQIFHNNIEGTNNDLYTLGDPRVVYRKGAELTIAAGVITAFTSYHQVDTEADAASDDLDTINGGADGMVLVLRAQSSARTVVLKDGTGNLALAGDFSLTQVHDSITLMYDDGTGFWFESSRSDNGA